MIFQVLLYCFLSSQAAKFCSRWESTIWPKWAFQAARFARFSSRCLQINPVIESAASTASPISKMQEVARTMAWHTDGRSGAPLHFGQRRGCTNGILQAWGNASKRSATRFQRRMQSSEKLHILPLEPILDWPRCTKHATTAQDNLHSSAGECVRQCRSRATGPC